MEQWVQDGRDTIRDRGFSRIPTYVEEDGYTIDTTGGLRGMLKLAKKGITNSSEMNSAAPPTTTHVDPKASPSGESKPAINFSKGLPQLYAECEVDYEYRFNGRIVDTNNEDLALAMLIEQIAKEEREAEALKAMEAEMEKHTAAAIAKEKEDGNVLPTASAAPSVSQYDYAAMSKIVADGSTAYPTPTKIPTASTYYPLDLVLGAGQVTQAVDEALLGMYEGEETEWWLDPSFAFRDHGLRTKFGSIPADASIQMKIKLLRFVNPMSSHERVLLGATLKDEANVLLQRSVKLASEEEAAKKGQEKSGTSPSPSSQIEEGSDATPKAESDALLQQAILAYNNALNKLGKTFVYKKASTTSPTPGSSQDAPVEKSNDEQKVLDAQLRAVIFTNLALCWFRKNDISRASEYVERAIKYNPLYSKALYRKALIEERRCNFDEAIYILERIISMAESREATDSATINVGEIKAKIESLRGISAKQSEAQRKTYQGMFGKGGL